LSCVFTKVDGVLVVNQMGRFIFPIQDEIHA